MSQDHWALGTKALHIQMSTHWPLYGVLHISRESLVFNVQPLTRKQILTVRLLLIVAHGHQKFEASSLATFNKKIADMKQGIPLQMEIDEIAPCQVTDITDPSLDKLEVTEDQSVIHNEE
jgi:hypothetical protein